MEIIKTATDWAKAEVFSYTFFILFGIIFMLASLGFWQLGKTEIAKAYVLPTIVAGSLLLIIGIGLFYTNVTRFSKFEADFKNNAIGFVKSEIARADNTLHEYKTIVFTSIPILIIVFSLVIIFVNKPIWRASSITAIAMLIVILLVDGTAQARIKAYKEQLILVDK